MRRKKKDKNNINNQEEIDLIPIESQQEETEVGTQPDAEPENPEATAEDTSDASLETETEVESIKTEAESAEPEVRKWQQRIRLHSRKHRRKKANLLHCLVRMLLRRTNGSARTGSRMRRSSKTGEEACEVRGC